MSTKNSTAEQEKHIIYLLDQAVETGVPVEIVRKGKKLLVYPAGPENKLDRLKEHPDFVVGDPEDLLHVEWSAHWHPTL